MPPRRRCQHLSSQQCTEPPPREVSSSDLSVQERTEPPQLSSKRPSSQAGSEPSPQQSSNCKGTSGRTEPPPQSSNCKGTNGRTEPPPQSSNREGMNGRTEAPPQSSPGAACGRPSTVSSTPGSIACPRCAALQPHGRQAASGRALHLRAARPPQACCRCCRRACGQTWTLLLRRCCRVRRTARRGRRRGGGGVIGNRALIGGKSPLIGRSQLHRGPYESAHEGCAPFSMRLLITDMHLCTRGGGTSQGYR